MRHLTRNLTRKQAIELYKDVYNDNDTTTLRELCLTDLFFLIASVCRRKDVDHDWLYARCREVEEKPDEMLDLWSREHYKSTLITFGKTIQDILINPEITIAIFSHTRPIAKAFLNQIKREFETNTFLKDLFPDILYANPQKESPKWALDDGIIVKRKGNPKESTVEAWGIVDSQPTSKHYGLMVYDDVVTEKSVTTPEMIQKVNDSFSLSLNLGGKEVKRRFIGTRYHANDTYKLIIDRKIATPRIYPATDNGKINGNPVFFTKEKYDKKVRELGSYISSCQLLQDPLQDSAMGFNKDDMRFYDNIDEALLNIYILGDPASKKKKKSDYTVYWVIGLGSDQKYYILGGIRDRLNLNDRTSKLFEFHKEWFPLDVIYEEYGMQCDIEHIQYVQDQKTYNFDITPVGGSMNKFDRIMRLAPDFENHRFYFPKSLIFVGNDGKTHDMIKEFISDELTTFPVCSHDDMLDCLSRIYDCELEFPSKDNNFFNTKRPVFSGAGGW